MRQLLHCPPSPSCLSFTLAVSQTQQHCLPLVLPVRCVRCVTNTMAASLVAILPAHHACHVTNTMTTSPVAVLPAHRACHVTTSLRVVAILPTHHVPLVPHVCHVTNTVVHCSLPSCSSLVSALSHMTTAASSSPSHPSITSSCVTNMPVHHSRCLTPPACLSAIM